MRKQYHFWPGHGGLDAWDVDRLIELSASLGVEDVPVTAIYEVDTVYWFDEMQQPTVRKVIEHCRLIGEVDLSYPIILGPDGRVMDGMHRVARAILEGRSVISAVRFPELPDPDHRNCRPNELSYSWPDRRSDARSCLRSSRLWLDELEGFSRRVAVAVNASLANVFASRAARGWAWRTPTALGHAGCYRPSPVGRPSPEGETSRRRPAVGEPGPELDLCW